MSRHQGNSGTTWTCAEMDRFARNAVNDKLALQAKLDRIGDAADLAARAYGGHVAELAARIRKIIDGEAGA